MKGYMFFKCKKCGHELYTDKVIKTCRNLHNTDCPECGEEGYENWIVLEERTADGYAIDESKDKLNATKESN